MANPINENLYLRCDLKYITIFYTKTIESVKTMIQEHYNIPEYDNTLFLINNIRLINLNQEDKKFARIIYYNLEHGNDLSPHEKFLVSNFVKNNNVTEIWSMEPNCETFDTEIGVKFMPVRYTSLIKKPEYKTQPKFDVGFTGIVGSNEWCPKRNDFFEKFITNPKYQFSIKMLYGFPISEMVDEFSNCKFVIDSHRNYWTTEQNQIRIFEHICLGHTVLSEKSKYNMFPDLIYEWNDIDELNELINTIEPHDFSEKYKQLTYSDEDYKAYREKLLDDNYYQPTHDYFNQCGLKRYDVINLLIKNFNFESYLEIGVFNGENFVKVECENKTSVDPEQFGYTTHQMTSDQYFDQLSEDIKFDIIFIDGLHLWEQCYKDINNSLKHLSPNGVIICHDMNPIEEMYQSRVKNSFIWNGDVWKAFVKLRSERNDLFTCMLEDCDYGLGIITWGNQETIKLDKSMEELLYCDFIENKPYLMNTTTIKDFINYNKL